MFKTPDAFDQVKNEIPDDECESAFRFVFDKYVKFGELITIEFDTETQTAIAIR
jgi:hypothetical protein